MKINFLKFFSRYFYAANALALAVVVVFIIYPAFFPEILRIQAKNEVNPLSKGNEVWVRLYDSSGNDVTKKLKPSGAGWVEKNGWWLSGGGESLVAELTYPASYRLQFVSHPWSGIATISMGTEVKTREVDLFSQEHESKEVSLQGHGVRGPAIFLGAALGFVFFFLLVCLSHKGLLEDAGGGGVRSAVRLACGVVILAGLLAVVWPTAQFQGLWHAGDYASATAVQLALGVLLISFTVASALVKRRLELRPATKKDCIKASLLVFVAGLFWLAALFPGLMSEDSINAFSQLAENTRLVDFPAIHTIYLDVFREKDSVWPVSVVQVLLLSIIFFYCSKQFISVGLSRFGVYASAVIMSAMPIVMVTAITMWRDVPYSLAVFLFSGLMFSFAVKGGRVLRCWSSMFVWTLCLSVIFLFRFNGFFVVLGAIFIIFFARPESRKNIIVILSAVLLIVVCVKRVIYPSYDVVSPGYTNFGVAHHVAAHIKSKTTISSEDFQFLESIRPISSDSWGYDCSAANGVVFSKDYNASLAEENISKYISVWFRLAMANPLVELKHGICAADLVWHVPGLYGKYVFAVEKMEGGYRYIKPNPYVQERSVLRPDLLQRLLRGLHEIDAPVLVRPAFFLYVLIWASVVAYLAAPGRQWAYLLVPVILNSLSVALMTVAQDVRYQYPVFLLSSFLVPILLTLTNDDKVRNPVLSLSVDRV